MHKSIAAIIKELSKKSNLSENQINALFVKNPSETGKIYSKSEVLEFFNQHENELALDETCKENFLSNITMKKIRTLSGVTTVTVLTKPFACPGKCIFCPNDISMPKSYIASEPGAQRALVNRFDPYTQTYNRLLALKNIGHSTDKVELIILGGTWTAYPKEYQVWFVKRCFDALNEFDPFKSLDAKAAPDYTHAAKAYYKDDGTINYNVSVSQTNAVRESATWDDLLMAQNLNESAKTKCVGLVIETRPDEITQAEVENIRKLGATKVQLGVQSLDDNVLKLNKRGHDSNQTALAFSLLRQAGFKVHAHYMPNLYGSSPKNDIDDFQKLFSDPRFMPDELKIYPCSLIAGTELMNLYNSGQWKPYSNEDLNWVLRECLQKVPRYCRVTRMIRDIPSQEIVDGNKLTNFRQLIEESLKKDKVVLSEIRSREIKDTFVTKNDLHILTTEYTTANSTEYFIEFVTLDDKIAGFLRLSLPNADSFLEELQNCAMIREVHVYGSSLPIGDSQLGVAQHSGLGTELIQEAVKISSTHNFKKLAVISSIGTRNYYKKFGFVLNNLYQIKNLDSK